MKMLHHREKGFTLIELLIVVAILGIIAAVIIPNLGTFMSIGTLSAANSEAENVKTASLAYYADAHEWPENTLTANFSQYIAGTLKAEYHFDDNGFIDGVGNPGVPPLAGGTTSDGYGGIVWQNFEGGVASVEGHGQWVRE
jgi:prepilin-type N-terminal cleavage/methylation domain-containing protein